jgi:hypothetical protein
MSFAAEMKDFIDAFESGTKIQHIAAQTRYTKSKTVPRPEGLTPENAPSSFGGGDGGGVGTREAPQVTGGKEGSDRRSSTQMPNAGGKQIGQQAYDYYRSLGLSHVTSAGIVGNLMQESGGDPRVISGVRRGDKGASGYIAQWNNGGAPRLDNLLKFSKERGNSTPTLKDQLDFVLEEMNPESPYRDAQASQMWPSLQNAKSIEEATQLFRDHFERPSDPGDIKPRLRYAASFQDAGTTADPFKFTGGKGAIPEEEEEEDTGGGYTPEEEEEDLSDIGSPAEIDVVAAPAADIGATPQVANEFEVNPWVVRRGGVIPDDYY